MPRFCSAFVFAGAAFLLCRPRGRLLRLRVVCRAIWRGRLTRRFLSAPPARADEAEVELAGVDVHRRHGHAHRVAQPVASCRERKPAITWPARS